MEDSHHKINRLHERALIIVYNDHVSSFQDLLNRDNSFTIHHQNIQSLTIKIYKTLNNLPGGTFEGLFTLRTDSYYLRSEQEVIIPKVSTILKRKNSLRYFGAIIWNSIPSVIRNTESYNEFYSNSFSANFTKWSNTLKQFVGNLATNCLSVTILWDWRL